MAVTSHPGPFLKAKVLPRFKRSDAEIARLLCVSRRRLSDLLHGRSRLKTDLALRLGKLTGIDPTVWMTMQRSRDLEIAEKSLATVIARIPTLEAAE